MAVNEAVRLRLYEKARESWGDEAADALMDCLPRDPDRFATKDDLAMLESSLTSTLTTRFLTMLLATNATLVGLVLAAVKLG